MKKKSSQKFVIKPFRANVHMDTSTADKIWSALQLAIGEIHNKNASTLSFEELYRQAYSLVLHKHGEKLYNGVYTTVRKHLLSIADEVSDAPDETLLVALARRWDDHKVTMVMIRDILMYMDRTYVVQNKKTPVYDMGLEIFRDTIARHLRVKGRLVKLLLSNIDKERRGEQIDRLLMKNSLSMLVELGVHSRDVYEEDFEKVFLETTRDFYHNESLEYITKNTCPDYMKKAEDRIKEERQRAQNYLDSCTQPRQMQIVQNELVQAHAKTLVEMKNSGAVAMFHDDKVEDLNRMYELFHCVGTETLHVIRDAMAAHVKSQGRSLVTDQERSKRPVEFVQGLLDLRTKYGSIVTDAFDDDKSFQKSLKEAFEDFINIDQRCAQYLSMYIDEVLRNKLRQRQHDMDDVLDRVIVIFRYLQDKDVFENFYKQHLAKRLLSGRSVSEDSERAMITKLKAECGYQFTAKLEGMFSDMKLSKEFMEKYKKQAKAGTFAGDMTRASDRREVQLDVSVLTTGFWPTEAAPKCELPEEVLGACEQFRDFYLKTYTGRRLKWQTNMGTAEIEATFWPTGKRSSRAKEGKHSSGEGSGSGASSGAGQPNTSAAAMGAGSDAAKPKKRKKKKKHLLIVTTHQMCILLLYNSRKSDERLTFKEIQDATKIEQIPDLKRQLLSLAVPKFRILHKHPKGKHIDDSTHFAVNDDFRSKLYRVKVLLVSLKSKSAGPEKLPPQVEEDRRHLVEASIVRIMKTRKKLEHNHLIAEVVKQLSSRFNPTPQMVKKRIESLIEREYLERSTEDRRVYRYLA